MLWDNSTSVIETGQDKRMNALYVQMIKDLEDTRDVYKGYSYIRTMRNILIGNERAVIAPHFRDKKYYGQFKKLKLEAAEHIFDYLAQTNQIDIIFTEHGKLYCTHDYYKEMCRRRQ